MFDNYGIDNCKISLSEKIEADNSDKLKLSEAKYITEANISHIQVENNEIN